MSQLIFRPQLQPDAAYPVNQRSRQIETHQSSLYATASFVLRVIAMMSLIWLLMLPMLVFVGYFGYFQAFERIIPGVHLGNTRLGGLKVSDAAAQLHKSWNMERYLLVGAVLSGEVQTWKIPPGSIGLSLDPLATAQNAYAIGHGYNLPEELYQFTFSLFKGWEVTPVIEYDEETAYTGLESLSTELAIAPRDATFLLMGDTLTTIPAEPGYAIDIDNTLAALSVNPQKVFADGYLLLFVKEIPPSITDVSAAMAEAQRLLNAQVNLSAYDPISNEQFYWQVPREVIKAWLVVESSEQGPRATIDENRVAEYLDALPESLGLNQGRYLNTPEHARQIVRAIENDEQVTLIMKHRPTIYVIQPGDTLLKISWRVGMPYWKILEANPFLNPDMLLAGQEITIPSRDELLPLPVIPNKRIVINLSQQHLWVYQDGVLRSDHKISTGIDRSPTQPGVFQVQTHEPNAYASVWDLYMPNFLGIYEAWPGFMNGLHGLPTLSSGRRLWENILGSPASFGCIILDLDASAMLYNWAEDGVIVEIQH